MRSLDCRQWACALCFLVVVPLTIVFAVRAVRPALYWYHHQDEPIRLWMNVGYVAHSYHVPPHVLYQALGLPHRPRDKRPIGVIARAQNRPAREMVAILENAIIHARPPYPPPPPPPPDAIGSP